MKLSPHECNDVNQGPQYWLCLCETLDESLYQVQNYFDIKKIYHKEWWVILKIKYGSITQKWTYLVRLHVTYLLPSYRISKDKQLNYVMVQWFQCKMEWNVGEEGCRSNPHYCFKVYLISLIASVHIDVW